MTFWMMLDDGLDDIGRRLWVTGYILDYVG